MKKNITSILLISILILTNSFGIVNISYSQINSYSESINWSGYILYDKPYTNSYINGVLSSAYIKTINKFDNENHGGFSVWAGISPNPEGLELFQGGYHAFYSPASTESIAKRYYIFVMHYIAGSNNCTFRATQVSPNQEVNIIITQWGDTPWHYLVEVVADDKYVVFDEDAVAGQRLRYATFITEIPPESPPAIPADNYVTQYDMYLFTDIGQHNASYYIQQGWYIRDYLVRDDIEVWPYFFESSNTIKYVFRY